MDPRFPCPFCNALVRLPALVRWTRLTLMHHPPESGLLEFPCPVCHRALVYPFDVPQAAA